MINFFLISLVVTFLITRSWAYFTYRKNDYFDSADNPKTLIGWLRVKTGFDWKYVHFGVILFFIDSLLIYSKGFNDLNNILFGISLSIILDQIFPLIANWDYFSEKMFYTSVLMHFIAMLVSIKTF